MADRNLYAKYKKDTQHVLYYMINATNSILRSRPGADVEQNQHGLAINTTGKATPSSMVAMAKLIREYINPVPDIILFYLIL